MISRPGSVIKSLFVLIAICINFPCVGSAAGPEISFEPRHFLDPLHTRPDQELTETLRIYNPGDETLNFSDIYLSDVGDGTDWIVLGTYDASVAAGSFIDLAITFNPNGMLSSGPDPAGYDALLIVSHDAPSAIDTVAVHLTVASDFDLPQQGVLNTTCKALMVYNTGRLGGGNEGYSLDIPGDCDSAETPPNALMYLNHASPLIAWNDGSENLAYTTLFSQDFTEDGTFRPQSALHSYTGIDHGAGTYDMVVCTLTTSDSLFAVAVRLFAPTDGANCFMLGEFSFFNWNPLKAADEVYVGLIADWDIPSDNDVDNGSGFNAELKTMWQYGAEYDTLEQDNLNACGGIGITETDRLGGVAILSGVAQIKNAWAEPNELYLLGSGFDKEYLYNRMSTSSGYNPYTGDSLVNIHTGMTFDCVDFTARAEYSYVFALITTNQGEGDYLDQACRAEAWAFRQELIVIFGTPLPGDANWDWQVNVGDAVYLISYIFKGGPAPGAGLCGGDANGDCVCNVGDAVYIISYVFKGGPPPPAYWDWQFQCGCP